MQLEPIIEKLQYYNQLSRLCYRILKSCQVKENLEMEMPARVFVSSKNMFIEINTSNPFFVNEKHILFALIHEALHIAFGHMFLDLSLYDMDKLNVALDASINSYIQTYIDDKYFSPIIEHVDGTFFSGFSSISEKNTWEYMYNNLQYNLEQKEEQQEQDKQQEDQEQDKDQEKESETQDNKKDKQDETEKQETNEFGEENNNDEENNQNGSGGSGDKQNAGESGNTPGNQQSNTKGTNRKSTERRSGGGSTTYQQSNLNSFDFHDFVEKPRKATEALFQEIVLEAIEDLEISIGTDLGNSLVKGLPFYQTAKQKWRRALSTAVLKAIKIKGKESTWKRPSRRSSNSIIPTPGKRKLYYPSIGVMVDCSGSMLRYTKDVLNHIASITSETGGIDYLIGGDVEKLIDLKNVTKSKLANIELKGFGGTILHDMIRELAKKPIDIMIIITDLEICDSDVVGIEKIPKKIKTILCIPENDTYIKTTIERLKRRRVSIIKINEER